MVGHRFFGRKSGFVSFSLIFFLAVPGGKARTVFSGNFAALEGFVKPVEQPFRQEICLNGFWQFQPVAVPAGYRRDQGVPPELPPPGDAWEKTPIKIPSPWNVNTWGCGREVGAGTPHPFWPDSVCFPSYPVSWDDAQMGWLKRNFRIPTGWNNKRVLLHFDAVAGDCQVLVNGKPAGEHFDNFLPFDLDITALIKYNADNELLVGVRSSHLYDKTNAVYRRESATYPDGSYLDGIVGIWQDVYLLGVPDVRVANVFVQPWVDRNELQIQASVWNDKDVPEDVTVAGSVCPWVNDAGTNVLTVPEPEWHLGAAVLRLPEKTIRIGPGTNAVGTLIINVGDKLELWSPDSPNLYGLVLTVKSENQIIDTRYQRFGWRQFEIQGSTLLLNGRKFKIFADIMHPFGVFTQSRRTAWAWFKMIQDVGGNGVRLHAQPWPSYYLDLADEMGLVVLDEDALFGSSLRLNFTDPVSWKRFARHYHELILRDRNHPSVFGWSLGNELFAIFDYNDMGQADRNRYYSELTAFGRTGLKLDPTRPWISCDGDQDLRGTLPVWSRHFGLGLHLDLLPANLNKPLMIGESGGTYYARPAELAVFNGEAAYESYAGRNNALGIDAYQNIVKMARPLLTYFSASELVWFGLEHLPLGYNDLNRLPNLNDGVFFKSFQEGNPGMQPERLPPYCTTLNPGWDPQLPLYKPMAMFEAMKAALAEKGPRPCPWDHLQIISPSPATNETTITSVGFIGDRSGKLFARMTDLGVPFGPDSPSPKMLIIDGERLSDFQANEIKAQANSVLAQGGQVLICLRQRTDDVAQVNGILPAPVSLNEREATALDRGISCSENAGISLADLYFAENGADKYIIKCGLDGGFVRQGTIVFKASNTDWSQFNDVSENAKCAAVELYEHLEKPFGAAMVTMNQNKGHIFVSTIDYAPDNEAYVNLWRHILRNMGVKLGTAEHAVKLSLSL